MPSKRLQVQHFFDGGWATDFGPVYLGVPDYYTKRLAIPFLSTAQDIEFMLDGAPKKLGGTVKLNASALAQTGITGIFDYWHQGASGTPARRRVAFAGTAIYADANDAVFTNVLKTGLTAAATPCFGQLNDLLVLCTDDLSAVPMSWDQTTFQNLAGSPPAFQWCVPHNGYLFAGGDPANPSRLYYSSYKDPTTWTGGTSGTIDINISDGDSLLGAASYNGVLFIFKGPNKCSIWTLTGKSNADFALPPVYRTGISAAWQNAIFPYNGDIGFLSPTGIVSSLQTTAAAGGYVQNSLSRPINSWLQQHLNFAKLRKSWIVNDALRERVYFALPIDGSAVPNVLLEMDYRFTPPRWSKLSSYSFITALGLFNEGSQIQTIGAGGDGYLRKMFQEACTLDTGNSISGIAQTPFLNYGDSYTAKTIGAMGISIVPKGNYPIFMDWQRDNNAPQTISFTQAGGGGGQLGVVASNQFMLDSSTLNAASYADLYNDTENFGEFRGVQYSFRNGSYNQDMEVHGFTSSIESDGLTSEAAL